MRKRKQENSLKLTIIGDSTVGKSSLLERIVHNRFYESTCNTIGGAFMSCVKQHNNKLYKFQIWDTAGQERYKSLVPMYLKDSKIVMIVIDITSQSTFDSVKKHWLKFAIQNAEDAHKILIGSKLDLHKYRECDSSDVTNYANEHGLEYIECSSKTQENLDELIELLCKRAETINANYTNNEDDVINSVITLNKTEQSDEEGGWVEYATTNCVPKCIIQ